MTTNTKTEATVPVSGTAEMTRDMLCAALDLSSEPHVRNHLWVDPDTFSVDYIRGAIADAVIVFGLPYIVDSVEAQRANAVAEEQWVRGLVAAEYRAIDRAFPALAPKSVAA